MEVSRHKILIAKHLSGELNPGEMQEFNEWLNANPSNLNELRESEKVWNLAEGKELLADPETEAYWQKLLLKIEEQKKISSSVKFRYIKWTAVAASVILLATIAFFFRINSSIPEIIKTTAAKPDVFYLPDSTIVWLDKSSQLTYPQEFKGKTREVILKGHAYFKVKKNEAQPFIVQAGETETKVLGTAFDIVSYDELSYVELIVSEGKVMFSSVADTIILEKNEKGVFEKESKMISKIVTLDAGSITWIEDKKEFTETEEYRKEISLPIYYIRNSISWKRNLINQTVIDGYITNAAIFTSYKNVILKVTHYNSKGKVLGENRFVIEDTIQPGQSVEYKYKLPDWFEKTKDVSVQIVKASLVGEDLEPKPEEDKNLIERKPPVN